MFLVRGCEYSFPILWAQGELDSAARARRVLIEENGKRGNEKWRNEEMDVIDIDLQVQVHGRLA